MYSAAIWQQLSFFAVAVCDVM